MTSIKIPGNNLGSYLTQKEAANIDIFAKTSIPTVELSKLRSGQIKKISAKKLAHIIKSIDENIEEAIIDIYPHVKLKEIKENLDIIVTLDDFFSNVEENTLHQISKKTGISALRLKDLRNKKTAVPLGHEIYLIELATKKKPGSLFKLLYGDLKLNPPELEKKLREEEKQRSRKS